VRDRTQSRTLAPNSAHPRAPSEILRTPAHPRAPRATPATTLVMAHDSWAMAHES
jgi:hypothetical protein